MSSKNTYSLPLNYIEDHDWIIKKWAGDILPSIVIFRCSNCGMEADADFVGEVPNAVDFWVEAGLDNYGNMCWSRHPWISCAKAIMKQAIE